MKVFVADNSIVLSVPTMRSIPSITDNNNGRDECNFIVNVLKTQK